MSDLEIGNLYATTPNTVTGKGNKGAPAPIIDDKASDFTQKAPNLEGTGTQGVPTAIALKGKDMHLPPVANVDPQGDDRGSGPVPSKGNKPRNW